MRRGLSALFVLLLLFAAVPSAQTPSGEITGTAVDSSSSVMPGVRITLTNVATKATRLTQTNESGVYVFPAVPPGTYTLRAELDGFSTVERANVWRQQLSGGPPVKITDLTDLGIVRGKRTPEGSGLIVARGVATTDAYLVSNFQ